MFDLTGRTALITGAGSGIGAAIATALHGAGAAVVLSGRNAANLDAVASGLARARTTTADLAQPGAADALMTQAGRVDILVNNAGLTRDGLAVRMGDDAWAEVLAVDLTAPFALARAAARGMMKARWGRIINITSVVAKTGNAGQANYCAAKAGVEGWSRALAAELAPRGVTVNCIAPGFIVTAMTEALGEGQREALAARIPAGRLGAPEDIAGAAVFLASDAASYITGHTLHVNGGMAMG
ncbi:MAG TPA: beta-ketoacyl-ACP reductase [Rhodospirillaceae bacterium]|jgi:3-oxoacyl-[acyl-carrier protein] reductase|nr:3-oxoacyl-ACP reductase FabG [Alphaproteobacteria bacterium]HBH26208.1 beta-ketoacyl-ACP reductase [Rhodospirillaceae bacterium]